ncbi:MAG TPA: hypothetical protein VKV74_15295 [Bryobacteraceae bacterium]|nr:hypothetical protein [Bryobacteraceae bacterium]
MKLDRRNLPDSDFALPKTRQYPIPDPLHARLALGEARANATASERKQIAEAIRKRYPQMAAEADELAA